MKALPAPANCILHFISRTSVKSSAFKEYFSNPRDCHQARLALSAHVLAFLTPSGPKKELNILFLFFHAFVSVS